MSEPAFDPSQLAESIYAIGDTAADPAQAATALRALLGQLEGGQHQAPGFGPGGQSMVQPEAVPAAPAQPVSIGQLPGLVDDVARKASTMAPEDSRDALWGLAETMNASLDAAAREQSPHLYPAPPATSDQELAALGDEIRQAWVDGSADEAAALELARRFNATLEGINDAHLRQVDDFEQRRVQAERQRQAKARAQDKTAATLRALAGQLDGAAGAGGR
jgi:hypothetical protein